jgi:pimeloyl-ACP methyl ester carboxylesterase
MIKIFFALGLLLISCVGDDSRGQQSASQTSVTLRPCDVTGVRGKAQCGTLEVFENRATRRGRKILLKITVLPATGSERAADPLFYIPGGPGSSAIEDAPGIAAFFAKIRERRDLVFVDQRGTGGSHPLNCKFYNPTDLQSYLGYFFPLAEVKQCRKELEATSDLKLYTTSIAMNDLDEVRAALGYERINIFGGSYGTRAALVYLRQHPAHVRTLVLQGVAPTDQFMPLDFAQSNERALRGVLDECLADEKCRTAFPNVQADAKTVLERLLRGPVEAEINANAGDQRSAPAASRQTVRVKLSRDLAAEAIRYMLYSPASAAQVPSVLHQAAGGNFVPLAERAYFYRLHLVGSGSNGLYLSITCAEDLPWIKAGEGERRAADTFLGDYRLRQQREACSLWPRAHIPKDYSAPVRGSAPVLIMTGQWDPVTPPANADRVARNLPNSLHVVVPHGAHGFGGLEGVECIEKLIRQFIEEADPKRLDTECVKHIRRKGFSTS